MPHVCAVVDDPLLPVCIHVLPDISIKMHAKMSIFAKCAARLIDAISADTAVDIRIGGSKVRFQIQIAVERAAGDFTE